MHLRGTRPKAAAHRHAAPGAAIWLQPALRLDVFRDWLA
jgi:hypothetical protein